jgi:hypothetical protein
MSTGPGYSGIPTEEEIDVFVSAAYRIHREQEGLPIGDLKGILGWTSRTWKPKLPFIR